MSLDQWLGDARLRLSQAQRVCNDANDYITSTMQQLALRDDRLPKLAFYMDAIRQQLRLADILKDSMELSVSRIFDRKNSLSTKLHKELAALNRTVDEMKGVRVDQAFDDQRQSLYKYISEQDLEELLARIDATVKQLEEHVKNIRTDALLIRMGSDLDNLRNEFTALETHFKTHQTKGSSSDSVSRLLKINDELELELVSVLKAFNNHYDQCQKGVQLENDPQVSATVKQNLRAVLADDVSELPDAMAYLERNRDTVVKNCKEVQRSVEIFLTFYDSVETFVGTMDEYGKHKLHKQFEDFAAVHTIIDSQLEQLDQLRASVSDYSNDYAQFITAYYALILEINRRADCNSKIDRLIQQFKGSLCQVINDDYDKRMEFFSLHGDFLPQNLVPAQVVNNPPPRVEIDFTADKLPEISNETVSEALRNIK